MRISVIIPVYNNARFLAAAIESVLAQETSRRKPRLMKFSSWTTVPSDDSVAVAQHFLPRIQIVSQENAGAAAARNTGLDNTSGEFVAFLDADDLMMPHRIAAQAAAMARPSQPDLVLSAQWLFRDGDTTRPSEDPAEIKRHLRPGLVPSTAFIRRTAFDTYGRFSPTHRIGDFVEWLSRATALGCRFEVLPEPLVMRRVHDANLSSTGPCGLCRPREGDPRPAAANNMTQLGSAARVSSRMAEGLLAERRPDAPAAGLPVPARNNCAGCISLSGRSESQLFFIDNGSSPAVADAL